MVNAGIAERKALGLPVRMNDPSSQVEGDDQRFKIALITPISPRETATFECEKTEENPSGTYKEEVPRLVATMGLGNLNDKEIRLSRIYFEIARRAEWYGFKQIAIAYYEKIVHLNISSQPYQMQLMRQILTETVSVNRKEESFGGTRDYTGDKPDGFKSFIDKFKNKTSPDGSAPQQPGQKYQSYNEMGLK